MTVNIQTDFGAVPDGTTDNTTAIQNALNSSDDIFIPSSAATGGFMHSNLSVAKAGTHLFGMGDNSLLVYKSSSNSTQLATGTNQVHFEKFKLEGGSTTDFRFSTAAENNRIGLRLAPQFNSRLVDVTIEGFGNTSLVYDPQTTIVGADDGKRVHMRDVFLRNSYNGYINMASWACEYVNTIGIRIVQCRNAYTDYAGNVNALGNNLYNNGQGLILDGTQYSNNSHSNFNCSIINHDVDYAVNANGIQVGYNLVGNQIHLGSIKLNNSCGVNISNGTLHCGEIDLSGTGVNYIRNNFMFSNTGLTNIINHNFGGSADQTQVKDNFTSTGMFPNSGAFVLSPSLNVDMRVTSQSISSGVWTKAAFNSVNSDSDASWDATNHWFNPKTSGKYLFLGVIGINATFSAGQDIVITAAKNGLTGSGGVIQATAPDLVPSLTGTQTAFVSGICDMNGSSDTLEIDVIITGTSPLIAAGVGLSSLTVFKLN